MKTPTTKKQFISVEKIYKARVRLKGVVEHTPLMRNFNLSEKYECNVFLKREDLQVVRSFKIRGAYYKMSQLTQAEAQNGIVHVIDAVIGANARPATVVDVIVNSPDHNTLETAVLAAGLGGALADPNATFSVFAPTDAAFAALDPATLDAALADPQGLLTTVLTYHVVQGYVEAGRLFDGQRMQTLQGSNIEFELNNSGAFVNNAQITVTDIMTGNGVVHVIDAVLLP